MSYPDDDYEPDDELSPDDEKLQEKMQHSVTYIGRFVNIYLIDRAYGGPEEGGWYYECGQAIDSREVLEDDLREVKGNAELWCIEENKNRRSDIGSVLSEGKYVVCIDDEPGKDYPSERPHYE
jgi:hypothetical protein